MALRLRYLVAIVLAMTGFGFASADGRTPKPEIVIEKQGQCIAPAAEMRRSHMDMLKHQRDKTVREGVRGAKVSLNACIDCHASSKNGSVLGSGQSFCQGCHSYAAVKLDCFECHQAKPVRDPVASSQGSNR